MAGLRIVLDTKVLVSGLAYPSSTPGSILAAWRGGAIDVVLSRYILDELERVLPRLDRLRQWCVQDIQDMVDSLSLLAIPASRSETPPMFPCSALCWLLPPNIWSRATRIC